MDLRQITSDLVEDAFGMWRYRWQALAVAWVVALAGWVWVLLIPNQYDATARVYDRWLAQHLTRANVRIRVDIFNAKAAMLRTGIGVGVLPTFMEARHPELVAVSEPIAELAQPVWMLTHPDLRQTARVRAFMQFVGDALVQRLRTA